MEPAPPPAGLDLSLDDLIGAGRRKEGRSGGGGGGGGGGGKRGGREARRGGERAPRHEDGDGGHGPARRRGSVLDRLGPPLGMGGGSGGGAYRGGGRGRGRGPRVPPAERAPRPPPGPHKQHETLTRGEDGSAVLSYDGHAIVTALPNGELVLDSGGAAAVQPSMEEALALFGLKLSASPVDASSWSVSDGRAFLKRFEDGMRIPCLNQPGLGRALALAASHGDADAEAELEALGGLGGAGGFRGGGGRGAPGGFRGRGRGRGAPRYAPY